MKAIFTKYHRYTATKPSRVSASDGDGNHTFKTLQTCYSDLNPERNSNAHREAALALCRKMDWTGTLAMGRCNNGQYVFVFVNPEELLEVR